MLRIVSPPRFRCAESKNFATHSLVLQCVVHVVSQTLASLLSLSLSLCFDFSSNPCKTSCNSPVKTQLCTLPLPFSIDITESTSSSLPRPPFPNNLNSLLLTKISLPHSLSLCFPSCFVRSSLHHRSLLSCDSQFSSHLVVYEVTIWVWLTPCARSSLTHTHNPQLLARSLPPKNNSVGCDRHCSLCSTLNTP